MAFELPSFIFGGETDIDSSAELQRNRRVSEALLRKQASRVPQNAWEGINSVTEALVARELGNRADTYEAGQRTAANEAFGNLFGEGADPTIQDLAGMMGNEYATDGHQSVINALLGQRLQQQDPSYQIGLERDQLELDALRNPQPKLTDDMREYEFAVSQGYDGTLLDFITGQRKAGATNITNTVGGNAPGLGKLSSDYGYVLDPETREPVVDPETGLPTAAAIPGSPAALDAAAEAAAAETKTETTNRGANIVVDDVDRALDVIETNPEFTTGFVGNIAQAVPGTAAHDVGKLITTIKANAGFDRLQQMRDSSVTGGALGAINKTEMDLLQSAIGNLEQSQSAEQLAFNLKRVKNIYLDIIHGEGNGPPRETLAGDQSNGSAPQGIEQDLWDAMTPEEQALWN